MAMPNTDQIKEELELFDIGYEDELVLDKMLEQCLCHRMKGDEIVLEWVAFSTTKGGRKLSLDHLEQFQHEVLNKKNKSKQTAKKDDSYNRTRDINSIQDLIKAEEEEENLLDSYSTPAKGSQKRALTTPEHPQSKRCARMTSPGLILSPASFSPCATPSQKYSVRSTRGEVVSTFGEAQDKLWSAQKGQRSVSVMPLLSGEDALTSSYKYMFQRLRDIRDVLTEKIEGLGEELKLHFNIEEISPVSLPAQDKMTVLGQVCCDSNGKLNAQSVLLEAGQEHGGRQVRLDLSDLREYSLFPGQVVIMEGMNTDGLKFMPSKLYEGVPLPFYSPEVKEESEEESKPVMVLTACGPFTPSDSLAYDPLIDLLTVINRDRPDVCILLGPFVDSKHEQIEKCQVTETFESIFARCVNSLVEGTRGIGCKLVFVPSQRDVHHNCIYPQPPFTLPDLSKEDVERVSLVSDPCTLVIEGVTFGLTSTDILFHMGAEEINSAAGSDRFSRIMKHMLTQRSYYPLYPPTEEINMDYEKFQLYGHMPVTPDILVVPSELRYFIKDVIGCLCINPGRLTKGQVGGTFGRLVVQRRGPDAEGKRRSPCLTGQVVKI
ncbi:DNA polymerase alpha subunit B-like [Clupea harengus]|uniref:DNA polymerase alpha subunit B n=1 Tax=Clupea harengus TaxID=7950 RepID=A0A6P8GVV3_CLUHA|nr:DNA polymerase alpha subunit B-like [Clupea harengus]